MPKEEKKKVRTFRLRPKVGSHYMKNVDGVEVEIKPGRTVKTTEDLTKKFPNKFDDLDEPEPETQTDEEEFIDQTLSDNVEGAKAKPKTKQEELEESESEEDGETAQEKAFADNEPKETEDTEEEPAGGDDEDDAAAKKTTKEPKAGKADPKPKTRNFRTK